MRSKAGTFPDNTLDGAEMANPEPKACSLLGGYEV